MKLCAKIAKYSLLVMFLALTGCDGIVDNFANNQPAQDLTISEREPIAVISIAPTEQWLDAFNGFVGSCNEREPFDIDQLVKQLPGIDLQQSVTIALYPSKRKTVQPVVYVPVVDYDQFISALAKRVHLNRAVASSFVVGNQKVLIKQRGDFAVFGKSLKEVNSAPTTPTIICDQMPKDAHLALKINTESLRESDRQKLATFLENFGTRLEPIAWESETIVAGLRFDADSGFVVQTKLYPVPEDLDDVRQSWQEAIARFGMPVSSDIVDGKMVFTCDVTVDDIAESCFKLGDSFVESLRVQQQVIAQQVSSGGGAPLPKITYLNSGFNASSSESSCSGGIRRRGG